MAATFAAVATLAAVDGGWAAEADDHGRRLAALVLLGVFGITLLFPVLSDQMTRPLVALGARLSQSAEQQAAVGRTSSLPSLLLGVAIGLLWVPRAWPVLGQILTSTALQAQASRPRCFWSHARPGGDVACTCLADGPAGVLPR